MLLWVEFILCTTVIVYSGTKLSKYGDVIAEKSGLGRAWTGLVLMASVTSLPELVTGMSSVTYAGVPDIAVGDVLGSCVFNMLILAILDTLYRPSPISTRAHQGHVLSAAFGILLLSMVCASILFREYIYPIGWIGPYSLMFIVIYLAAMRLVFFYEKRKIAEFLKEKAEEMKYKDVPMKTALLHYGMNALIVITAAIFLPKLGEGISESTGLGQTFVGNIFIAVSTSLPEVVVSISAVRMGAIDLATGNLFGSNIFNIFILALDDILFLKGPLLSYASPDHIISALSAIAMTTVAIIGLTYRAEKKRLFLAWDSVGILLCYILNLMMLYTLR
ncbi:MAG: sodium:calcium antiporter [Nitrospirae bacterium]|nr:sodium:calcium antiporter [Nitrospirota bacterium]